MTQSLTINGKEYIQSNILASKVGYSSDYIGRLAREEKVLGTRVGRVWFVEPESLNTFLHKTKIEKEIRKEELSRERKVELSSPKKQTEKIKSEEIGPVYREVKTLLQTSAILSCGILVGWLSFIVSAENISSDKLALAAKETVSLFASSIFSDVSIRSIAPPSSQNNLAASAEALSKKNEELIFTDLPVVPLQTNLSTSSFSVVGQFSDEVEVFLDEEGNEFIRPIFREENREPETFLLVPVSQFDPYE